MGIAPIPAQPANPIIQQPRQRRGLAPPVIQGSPDRRLHRPHQDRTPPGLGNGVQRRGVNPAPNGPNDDNNDDNWMDLDDDDVLYYHR